MNKNKSVSYLEHLTKSDPKTKNTTMGILKKIRQYGGVAKFIEQCPDKAEVDLVRQFRYVFGTWDKSNIAFKEKT